MLYESIDIRTRCFPFSRWMMKVSLSSWVRSAYKVNSFRNSPDVMAVILSFPFLFMNVIIPVFDK